MSRDRASRSSANAEMFRFDDHDAKRKRISGKIRAAAIARRISRIVSARECTHRPLETHCRVVIAQFEPEHYWLRRLLTQQTQDEWEPRLLPRNSVNRGLAGPPFLPSRLSYMRYGLFPARADGPGSESSAWMVAV